MEVVSGITPQNFVVERKKYEPGKEIIVNYHNISNIAKIESREYFGEDEMKGGEFATTAYDAFGNKLFESKMDGRTVIACLNGKYNDFSNSHTLDFNA